MMRQQRTRHAPARTSHTMQTTSSSTDAYSQAHGAYGPPPASGQAEYAMASLEKRVLAAILDTIFASLPVIACAVVAISLGIDDEGDMSTGALIAFFGVYTRFR